MLPIVVVILIGVSGSGKTTVGRALAAELGCQFVDATTITCRRPWPRCATARRSTPHRRRDRAEWRDPAHDPPRIRV
jgi:gluconokinase